MKKAAIVLIVIGIIFFAAGVFLIYTGFASQNSVENSLVFEKTVQARITDTRVGESVVGRHRKKGGGYTGGHTEYTYYVEFLVSDGDEAYTKEQSVPKSLYDEYVQLEKNKDMEFNIYVNPDGADFLSLKDIEGATADYQEIFVTKNIAVRMIAGLIAAAAGWVLLTSGVNMRKKAEKEGC